MQAVSMGVAKANGPFATTFLSAILAGTCPTSAQPCISKSRIAHGHVGVINVVDPVPCMIRPCLVASCGLADISTHQWLANEPGRSWPRLLSTSGNKLVAC